MKSLKSDQLLKAIASIGQYSGTRVDRAVLMLSAAKFITSQNSADISQICDWFELAHLARPNSTVLLRALVDDRRVSVRRRIVRALAPADGFLAAKFPELASIDLEEASKLSEDMRISLAKTPGIDQKYIGDLEKMLDLFATLHTLENSMRRLIQSVLSEKFGDDWWNKAASSTQQRKHQDRIEKEINRKWLPARSSLGPLYSLDWSDLISIMRKYEIIFAPIIEEIDFLHRFADLGLIRHVVAHHGFIDDERDYERVRIAHHDWVKQLNGLDF